MHQQSYRDQSNQLEELLTGPIVGSESGKIREGNLGEEISLKEENGKSSGVETIEVNAEEMADSGTIPGNVISFSQITQVNNTIRHRLNQTKLIKMNLMHSKLSSCNLE